MPSTADSEPELRTMGQVVSSLTITVAVVSRNDWPSASVPVTTIGTECSSRALRRFSAPGSSCSGVTFTEVLKG